MNASCSPAPDDRRGFLWKLAAVLLGIAASAVPAAAGLIVFLNPWRLKSHAGQFIRLTSLAALPEDGTPRKFPMIADRCDAWSRFPAEPIGAVYVGYKRATKEIVALQVVCPHAGCFITYDQAAKEFYCPCHSARFNMAGERTDANSPSPRDLDRLNAQEEGNEIHVAFERFRTGTSEKITEA
jgi:menaquinol-cytochrome c reductase iron-sulfur subunit